MRKKIRSHIVSLDIGAQNIKVVVGRIKKSELSISKTFHFKTPINCVEDGVIVDLVSLVSTIKKELSKHELHKGYMSINFSSTKIIERELELPSVNNKEIKEVIKYEIQQYLPIDIDKYIVQFKDINQTNDINEQSMHIMVSAIEETIVKKYFELVKKLGFKPLFFDTQSNSLDKLIWFIDKKYNSEFKRKTVAIVDFGYNLTTVTIFNKGKYTVSQSLNYGGSVIEKFLNDHLGKADHLKGKEEIENNLDIGVSKIQRMLRYYATKYKSDEIDEFYVYGGLSNSNGFCQYLEGKLNVPVKKMSTLNFLNVEFPNLDFNRYINNIGTLIKKEKEGKNE